MKNKPIKWWFKFWYHCASKTKYPYQLNLYLGKKEMWEENLGRSVVLALTECLEDKYCTIFFDNYFNSPYLIIKLFGKGLYKIGAVRNQTNRWREVIMNISLLFSNISARQSKSTVQQQMKGSATKIPVPSLDVIKSIINVWVASTWSTKEQQLTILFVNLQLDFIYLFFFLIWWMQLVSVVPSFTIWWIKTVKVLVAWTWSTKEQQLTILIVDL